MFVEKIVHPSETRKEAFFLKNIKTPHFMSLYKEHIHIGDLLIFIWV